LASELSYIDVMALREAAINHLWQRWNSFCRQLFMGSCLGALTKGGVTTVARPHWTTEPRVAYEALCAKAKKNPQPGQSLSHKRLEPTWGDVDVMTKIASQMQMTNSANIVSAFGLGVTGPKHLQIVRNSIAHKNDETFTNVKSIISNYKGVRLWQPSDIAAWNHAIDKDISIICWAEDLKAIADIACR
jgi:hypothetical protein